MIINLRPRQLAALWGAYGKPASRIEGAAERYAAEAVAAGWVSRYDVDDMLARLGMPYELRGFIEDFGLMPEPLFFRPRGNRDVAHPSDRVPAGTFAAAVVLLERLGLDVDPASIVEAVRPLLLKRDLLTRHELRVLWYAQERHGNAPVVLGALDAVCMEDTPHRLPTGYVVAPMLDAGGAVVAIEVRAPRHRPDKKTTRGAAPIRQLACAVRLNRNLDETIAAARHPPATRRTAFVPFQPTSETGCDQAL